MIFKIILSASILFFTGSIFYSNKIWNTFNETRMKQIDESLILNTLNSRSTFRVPWSIERGKKFRGELSSMAPGIFDLILKHSVVQDELVGFALSDISVEHAFRESLIGPKIEYFVENNPNFDTVEWRNNLRGRVKALISSKKDCSYVLMGKKSAGVFTKEAVFAESLIARLDKDISTIESFDKRLFLSLQAFDTIQRIEFDLNNAVSFPVINGDSKGTIPASGTLVLFCSKEKSKPSTGTIRNEIRGSCDFTLRTNRSSGDLYVRLVGTKGYEKGRTLYTAFVRSGTSLRVKLAEGDYELRYAMGENWYGTQYLFGPKTTFHKPQTVIDPKFGYELELSLTPQIMGNISTRDLDVQDF